MSNLVVKKSRTSSISRPHSTMQKPNQWEEIFHFSHPQHPLVNVDLPYIFTCSGCREFGAGKRLMCQVCEFYLHEFCALAPPSLQGHPLHKRHQLVFFTKSGGILRSKCDVCGKSAKGYTFRCTTCNFEMHPCCSTLHGEMNFLVHPHPLKLLHENAIMSSDSCSVCRRKRSGRVYHCEVCDYHLHAICAKDMVNGLYANGIRPPEKSIFGMAARVASQVFLGIIGGVIEGIGEGIGGALIDGIGRSRSTGTVRNR